MSAFRHVINVEHESSHVISAGGACVFEVSRKNDDAVTNTFNLGSIFKLGVTVVRVQIINTLFPER